MQDKVEEDRRRVDVDERLLYGSLSHLWPAAAIYCQCRLFMYKLMYNNLPTYAEGRYSPQ